MMNAASAMKKNPPEHFSARNCAHGDLTLPRQGAGLVVLSHNRQNSAMTGILRRHGLGILLSDFLAPDDVQAARLVEHVCDCAAQSSETAGFPLGCLATGADAAATLIAASHQPDLIRAVVVRGGKPDDALDVLPLIKAPVLLIAGGRDHGGLRSAQKAVEKLNSDSALNIIPRASAAFEETGTLEEAAQLAALWFLRHLEK